MRYAVVCLNGRGSRVWALGPFRTEEAAIHARERTGGTVVALREASSDSCPACGEPVADHYDGMSDLAACRGVRIERLEAEVERLRKAIVAALPHIERAPSSRQSAVAMRVLAEAIGRME